MLSPIPRRTFLQTSAASLATALAGPALAELASQRNEGAMANYSEAARSIPVVEESDVLVSGGGPAGAIAAIAAARAGAKVRLIERAGCLGGTWTAGLLSWIIDSGNKVGLVKELVARLRKRGSGKVFGGSVAYEPELMKLVLEEMCLEAGVSIRLHTLIAAAAKSATGRITHAITESKSGREAWAAKAFIDATGDGDLAARAGCGFDYGSPDTREAQPMSMICLVTGIDPTAVTPFVRGLAEPAGHGSPKGNLLKEMKRAGVTPSYAGPTIFHIAPDLFCFMINHEYGVCGFDESDTSMATIRARAEVHTLIDALRKTGGVWDGIRIVATAEHIGVREGRRIHGLYTITDQDLVEGRRFDDAVCHCRFGVDVHATNPNRNKGVDRTHVHARPYDIPYRSLLAKDVKGLLLAGRCISGEFIPHSSYRVTGDAAAMGQAAGVAAALCAQTDRMPDEIPWGEIRSRMAECLPG